MYRLVAMGSYICQKEKFKITQKKLDMLGDTY